MAQYVGEYLAVLAVVLLVLIAVKTTLQWLNPGNGVKKTWREHRHNILGVFSIIILVGAAGSWFVLRNEPQLVQANRLVTPAFVNSLKVIIKLMMFSGALMLILVVAAFFSGTVFVAAQKIYYALVRNDGSEKQSVNLTQKENKAHLLIEIAKAPEIVSLLTIGVLAVFVAIPLFFGNIHEGALKCWHDGVKRIGGILASGGGLPFTTAVVLYLIIYIIVLGILFCAANIVYTILEDTISGNGRAGFLHEYSSSIGVLAVSLAVLCSVYFGKDEHGLSKMAQMAQSVVLSLVGTVLIVAVIIVVLEIVRLLIDMKGTLIREEAGFIFVYLILLGATLIAQVLYSLYSAISSALAIDQTETDKVKEIYHSIIDGMCEVVEEKVVQLRNRMPLSKKTSFKVFERKITRK